MTYLSGGGGGGGISSDVVVGGCPLIFENLWGNAVERRFFRGIDVFSGGYTIIFQFPKFQGVGIYQWH